MIGRKESNLKSQGEPEKLERLDLLLTKIVGTMAE